MNAEQALRELGASTGEAMVGTLEMFAPGAAKCAEPVVAADVAATLADPPVPGLATSVAYVDGVTGGNVFLLPLAAAHRLAATMMGMDPADADPAAELSEMEHSATGEAMNQMMAAAAAATSTVLGYEVDIAPPQIIPTGSTDLATLLEGTAYATTTAFEICGEPCRFVQLVPHALVVRMTRALDERGAEAAVTTGEVDDAAQSALRASLATTSMRVSVEIGRTRMRVDRLVGLPPGAVIELDHEADDPIDILVNGRRFAVGRLVQTETDDWAVRVERVLTGSTAVRPRREGG